MNGRATGEFEVDLTPQEAAAELGRLTIAKRFTGDLQATSAGEMLSVQGGVAGSAGYVAMERVTGTLEGREGGFVLLHRGLMDRGVPTLDILVVPDSGTGALAGLTGTMTIDRTGGTHQYTFEYTLSGVF